MAETQHKWGQFSSLLAGGNFSDLILVTEDKEIHVHKAILCPQSPVFRAMCEGKFKEARENVIHTEFKQPQVQCMLNYLYSGDYQLPHDRIKYALEAPMDLDADIFQNYYDYDDYASNAAKFTMPRTSQQPQVKLTIIDLVRGHRDVFEIADYYGITGLRYLAFKRLGTCILNLTHWEGYMTAIAELSRGYPNEGIRKLVRRAVHTRIEDLYYKDDFDLIPHDVAVHLLKIRAQESAQAKEETIRRALYPDPDDLPYRDLVL